MLKRPVLVKIVAENYVWIEESDAEQFINCKNSLKEWSVGIVPKAEIINTSTLWHSSDEEIIFDKTESIMIPANSEIKSINIEQSTRKNITIKEEIELKEEN